MNTKKVKKDKINEKIRVISRVIIDKVQNGYLVRILDTETNEYEAVAVSQKDYTDEAEVEACVEALSIASLALEPSTSRYSSSRVRICSYPGDKSDLVVECPICGHLPEKEND